MLFTRTCITRTRIVRSVRTIIRGDGSILAICRAGYGAIIGAGRCLVVGRYVVGYLLGNKSAGFAKARIRRNILQ